MLLLLEARNQQHVGVQTLLMLNYHTMKKSQKTSEATSKHPILTGIIRIAGKGLGFIEIQGKEEDILIENENLNTALNKDEVEFVILPKKVKGRTVGKVTKIIKRAKMEFVGTLEHENGRLFLIPDDKKVYKDIAIVGDVSSEAQDNIKVLVKINDWTDPNRNPEGKIIKIIGKKGIHDVEMSAIVMSKGFATEFPPEVEEEAESISKNFGTITPNELAKRRDFRQTLTFTIDPIDAKDFDDAISFKKLPNGNFEIGVHIADVSHFVREHTELNREALKRGFSVYLVDRTIPMLPEALSNEVCSLKPNEDRLTFSAVFELDAQGKVKSRWFGKTIIHSAKRFTYEAAQDVLDGKSTEHKNELETLNALAKKMRDEKFKKGAIDFEQDEVRFELDETGRPIKIYKKKRLDTHKLVEEYMLLANKEVAEFIFKARENKKSDEPFIYRIHDLPDRERIANLGIFLKALGFDLTMRGGNVSAKDLQVLFSKIEGRAEESMIKTAAVRSMAKAIYSTINIGHFGLSFDYYTHFTSPIRRYADLLVHRVLFHHLNGTGIPQNEWHSYEKMARENSEQEIAAAEAERDSKKLKQVEYMSERVGQTFDGIISGVTEWGMYIEEKDTRCEGMIKLRDLGDDYYVLEEKTYSLVGEKTKKRFSLGDKIKFKVSGADIERKTLDYSLQ
ncbi:MAG: ribonuclease R [Candidatus Taylorbacteria bacterium]|nr:ribonuclease R [Candidatus Taylorbacteria bacterium]